MFYPLFAGAGGDDLGRGTDGRSLSGISILSTRAHGACYNYEKHGEGRRRRDDRRSIIPPLPQRRRGRSGRAYGALRHQADPLSGRLSLRPSRGGGSDDRGLCLSHRQKAGHPGRRLSRLPLPVSAAHGPAAAAQKAGEKLLLPGRADGGTGGPGAGGGSCAIGGAGAAPADLHGRAARGLPGGAVPCLFRGTEPRGDRRRHG